MLSLNWENSEVFYYTGDYDETFGIRRVICNDIPYIRPVT